jgi:hypothetical protein
MAGRRWATAALQRRLLRMVFCRNNGHNLGRHLQNGLGHR